MENIVEGETGNLQRLHRQDSHGTDNSSNGDAKDRMNIKNGLKFKNKEKGGYKKDQERQDQGLLQAHGKRMVQQPGIGSVEHNRKYNLKWLK